MKNRNGFTVIELLISMAVVSIMMLISLPNIINYLGKNKSRIYNNRLFFFVKKAQIYSLENTDGLVWTNTDIKDLLKSTILLRDLLGENNASGTIINPKTNEPYDADNTVVTIYKFSDGHLEYIYGDESPFVNSVEQQYVLNSESYDVMEDIYVNASGDQTKSNIVASCSYGKDNVSCDELMSQETKTGKYTVKYKYAEWEETREVDVVEPSKISITPQFDSDNSVALVSIDYPENAKSKTYKDAGGIHSYKGAFKITENQTITANCIDQYGFKCITETKKVTNTKPSIYYTEFTNEMVISASWPNTTSLDLEILGIKSDNGTEYKCKVGNKETKWSSSGKCSLTGLESGKAYTVVAYARDKINTSDILTKTTTIYTSKNVAEHASTGTGTCPTQTTKLVEASGIYDSILLQGSCSEDKKTCSAYSSITSDSKNLPNTMTISCSGVTSVVSGGEVKSYNNVVSCNVSGTKETNQSTCHTSIVTCNDISSTVSGKCTSSIIKTNSKYNCSSLSKSACSSVVSSKSVSYYSCVQSSYGPSVCYSTSTVNSVAYYGCSVSAGRDGGCGEWSCDKWSYGRSCTSYSGIKSSCALISKCVRSVCEVPIIELYDSYSSRGCSTNIVSNVIISYSCYGTVSSMGICSSKKNVSSISYYDCSVSSICTASNATTVYSITYPDVVLKSNKTTYYREYKASDIIYSKGYTISYSSSVVTPRKSIY